MSFVSRASAIDIIIGPMFSGKTTELHRRLNICSDADLNVIYINSEVDTRASTISTHNKSLSQNPKITYTKSVHLIDMIEICKKYDIIGIDEAQFFDDLVAFCRLMCETYHKKVIVCGLSGDFKRQPFGEILNLIPMCDSLTKTESFCTNCLKTGKEMIPALFSKRITSSDSKILVGGVGEYIPTCRKCFLL